jgi:hypothetical protein
MKSLKLIIFTLLFFTMNCIAVLSDITASAPTNLIQQIASASSYTSTSQNTEAIVKQVENITSSVVNVKELRKTVEKDAKAFGLAINEDALARMSGQTIAKKKSGTVTISADGDNVYETLEFPEPNLDTLVYDTGMMTLTKEGGKYNDDSSDTIFVAGAQKARVKVFIDFKRKKQWGSVESQIKLSTLGGDTKTNIVEGAAATITELPFESELIHIISSTTGKRLDIVELPQESFTYSGDNDAEPFLMESHSLTSLVKVGGDPADYFSGDERKNMQKAVSHSTASGNAAGDKNILVGASFSTGSVGTPGTTTASFEASHAAANDLGADFVDDKVVRYSKTVTTTASKYTGD